MFLIQQRGVQNIVDQWLKKLDQGDVVEHEVKEGVSYYLLKGSITTSHPLFKWSIEAATTLVPPEWDPRWSISLVDGHGFEWSTGEWWKLSDRPFSDRLAAPSHAIHAFVGATRGSAAMVVLTRKEHGGIDVLCRFLTPPWSQIEANSMKGPLSSGQEPLAEHLHFSDWEVAEGILDRAIQERLPKFLAGECFHLCATGQTNNTTGSNPRKFAV